jgi:hypothetical protein
MIHSLIGKRGRGKTSLIAELIASKPWDQIFIYDYLGEFMQFAIDGYITVCNTGFVDFAHYVWDNSHPGIETLLVLDEIAIFGKDNPQIDHLFRIGRHKQIQIISASQRFYTLPVIARSQTDIFHVFQITEQRDVQYLKGLVPPATMDRIINLQKFEYVDLDLS